MEVFWRVLDKVKGVAIGAGAASLLALVGVFLLGASLAATIAIWLPWSAALGLAALTFLLVAAIAMWLSVRSGKSSGDSKNGRGEGHDQDQISAAASAMVDLPIEAVKKMIQERPVAAVVLVSGLGLLIARKPEVALKMVDKILERFTGVSTGPDPRP